jgi:hypothetical protein
MIQVRNAANVTDHIKEWLTRLIPRGVIVKYPSIYRSSQKKRDGSHDW